ncbi:MAG TPA: gliding motility-associated C-terminal domain-containing protein, partial [Chitinophagales bacterium]|nr:gliding motility-associated C-terminal domain-containing protein [Chitinophagales bacterium]
TSTASVTDAGCYGSNAGAVDLSVAGGTPGYSFFWSNDETTEDLTSLPAGDYQVVITDANGCVHVDNITVTEFTELNVQPSVTNPSCIGKEDGKISLTVTGASPLSYEWSDGSTGAELDDLKAGSYTVTVTDANNCQQISTLVIEEPTANCGGSILDVAVPNAFSPNGDDINEQFDIYRADDVSKVTVKIYDRWGAKVYENPDQQHGPNQGWDGTYRGKEAQVGAYVYVMEIEYSTPNTTDRPTQKTGTVTLVR